MAGKPALVLPSALLPGLPLPPGVILRHNSIMATSKRFKHHSDDEIQAKKRCLIPKNTQKSNEKAYRAFKNYLEEVGETKDMLDLTVPELDAHLGKFWLALRKKDPNAGPKCVKINDIKEEDGEENENDLYYKATSLDGFRNGLKRFFKSQGKMFDIVKSPEFQQSHEDFNTAMKELKTIGKADVEHHVEIIDEGNIYITFFFMGQILKKVIAEEDS